MAIEEEFAIEIPDEDADAITSVGQGECFGVAYYRLERRLLASGTGVLDGLIEAPARERVVFDPESPHTPPVAPIIWDPCWAIHFQVS